MKPAHCAAGGPTGHEMLATPLALPPMRLKGADVVETSSPHHGPGQIAALLAAAVAFKSLAPHVTADRADVAL